MRKIYFFGIGILLFCLAGWGVYRVTKSHGNVADDEAVASISADSLYYQFQKSEPEANIKWVGKVLEIRGIISSVTQTGNSMFINLRVTDEGGINCSTLKKDLPPDAIFNKGDSVTIKGSCTGFLMDVNMVDCIVKK
jgi:hypothetical protein